MKYIKRVLLFLSLFLLYIILREMLDLYNALNDFHPAAGYAGMVLLSAVILYFVAIPVFRIIKIPRISGPVTDRKNEAQLIKTRLEAFRKNDYLNSIGFEIPAEADVVITYNSAVSELKKKCDDIRTRYITNLFYSTAIAQNGFLDAVLILSASVNLIREIFVLYNGRVSNRDLFTIAEKVYLSIAVGGSEVTEYATEEIIGKFASDALKSIPFLDKVMISITDGFVNAALLTRISFITENYCVMTYLDKQSDLSPSPKFILDTVTSITSDILEKVKYTLKAMGQEKISNYAKYVLNPAGFIFEKAFRRADSDNTVINPDTENNIAEINRITVSPVRYGFEKLTGSFRRKNTL